MASKELLVQRFLVQKYRAANALLIVQMIIYRLFLNHFLNG